jgi:hypothetical protein
VVTSEPAPAASDPAAKEDFQAEEEKAPVTDKPPPHRRSSQQRRKPQSPTAEEKLAEVRGKGSITYYSMDILIISCPQCLKGEQVSLTVNTLESHFLENFQCCLMHL